MKSTNLFIWFMVTTMVFTFTFSSCTEEDIILQDKTENISVVSTKAKKINAAITVYPSGDISGLTDVMAIENALVALSSGDILLLESGTFYINRTIIAPISFNGTVRGISMDQTQINPVGDDVSPFVLSSINVSGGPFPVQSSSLFFFPDPSGELNISHFSSTLPDGFATDVNFFGSQDFTSFITINFENNEADTHLSNLHFVGTEAHPTSSAFFVHQPNFGVQVLGNGLGFPNFVTGGTHTLTGCNISKVGVQATVYQLLKEAQIFVNNNSFSEIKQTIYRWLDGCAIDIAKNEMNTATLGAIVVTQEGVLVPGSGNPVHIHNNQVSTAGYMPIEIGSIPEGGANFDLLIEKNKLTVASDPLGFFSNFSGIGVFNENNEAFVRNNQIRGEADFGIISESNGGTFLGNNLQGINVFDANYGIFGNNNTLVGIGNSTVIDLGTNNMITGMQNVVGESIGERIQAAQAKRKEILDVFNNY